MRNLQTNSLHNNTGATDHRTSCANESAGESDDWFC